MALLTITPTDSQIQTITQALDKQVNKILGVLSVFFIIGVIVYLKVR